MKGYKINHRGGYSALDKSKLNYLLTIEAGYFPGDGIKKRLVKDLAHKRTHKFDGF